MNLVMGLYYTVSVEAPNMKGTLIRVEDPNGATVNLLEGPKHKVIMGL
jgi:hypothetical protein